MPTDDDKIHEVHKPFSRAASFLIYWGVLLICTSMLAFPIGMYFFGPIEGAIGGGVVVALLPLLLSLFIMTKKG